MKPLAYLVELGGPAVKTVTLSEAMAYRGLESTKVTPLVALEDAEAAIQAASQPQERGEAVAPLTTAWILHFDGYTNPESGHHVPAKPCMPADPSTPLDLYKSKDDVDEYISTMSCTPGREHYSAREVYIYLHPTPDAGRVAELEQKLSDQRRISVELNDQCVEYCRRIAALESQLTESREREGRMREALRLSRYCLQQANEIKNGPIRDTIWFSPHETLFDYMDSAIAAEKEGE